ncbi:MAG: Peptidase acyl-coenzyme A:6-aminopenicillanic acid acyl-transferase [Microvirga sp.]|jgi:hypothetical protein|nr:Peptidase acyl-coenzyme A:6-aminopenicillanic acid acyl-transferase [Microvirga sp.]
MIETKSATPLLLSGNAYERGRAQAACASQLIPAVQSAIDARLAAASDLLEKPAIRHFLAEQREILKAVDPEGGAEVAGIADGFDRPVASVLAYLHLSALADFAVDGCTAWSWGAGGSMGPLVVKNRDYRGEHVQLQRVFLHRDPGKPGKAVLCVGSLGSPGAFSSGMNAHGLALVDTHVATRDHGPGLLRYFLMTRLLWHCRNVSEALRMIADLPHAGGGSMVLGDESGACAAVELGHAAWAAECSGHYVFRTNHFVSPECAPFWLAPTDENAVTSTTGRHARLKSWLGQQTACPTFDEAAAVMSSHPEQGQESLCRHGEYGDSHTISCAIFAPTELRLYFSAGKPCAGQWSSFDCRP